jgi:D-alanyl-D-alanine-carboxypeptidase/D-alanyl-D-alanine-endopeptidase
MNQPDLGLKITELRQQKSLTQEKLAEYCDVSTRTIQRIESSEAEPRSFTRNSLSNILEFDFGKENTNNENLWLALLHISSVVCIVFIPLLLWSWKKDQSYKIDQQGRAVLNFQITITLVLFAFVLALMIVPAIMLMVQNLDGGPGILGDIFTLLPPIPILFVGIFTTYQAVVNTVRALSDKPIRYPLSIPFVK